MKLILWIAAAIAIARLFITPRLNVPTAEGSYEAVAHLFVGGLFGAWWMHYSHDEMNFHEVTKSRNYFLFIALGPSLFELGMFLIQKAM